MIAPILYAYNLASPRTKRAARAGAALAVLATACSPAYAGAGQGTIAPGAEKHCGFGSPESAKAQQPRPPWTAAFFMPVGCTRHAQQSFLVGCVGAPARVRRCLLPVFRPYTACHPSSEAMSGRVTTCSVGATMANTPQGRTAPASAHAPTLDTVALHFEAVNACAMARWYAARHQHAAAARKSVQALTALRRLAAFERTEAAA